MNLIDCLLAPCDLYLSQIDAPPRLAILGTCVAEHLVNAGASKDILISHYLLETGTHVPVPDIVTEDKDGIVIHLTLRHILDMAAGIDRGDVSYINTNIDELGVQAAEILKQRIASVAQHFSNKLPLFFLSFIEPPQTTKGFFHNNRTDSIYRLVRDLNDSMAEYLDKTAGAYYVETNDILSYYGCGNSADSYQQHFTHAGNFGNQQSDNFYLAILQRIFNALETLRASNPVKLIVTDLDNTLWKGVAAEEDEIVPWAHMEGWPIGYAEALLECKRRGILLAVCSKNNEAETMENFRKIWGEKIQPEDFFSLKINWNAKSENIRAIMEETNLLPSNVLFIDDNPLEIEEVSRAFPEIRTLSLPQQRWRNVLLHSPQTQTPTLSEESRNRTTLLKAKVERDKISTTMDRDAYLHSLDLRVDVRAIHDQNHTDFSRALELLNKTNQFNTTGQRWLEADLTYLLLHEHGVIYTAKVIDRLATHGLTAVAVVLDTKIIQVVMSCRVFGLGIETALLHTVMQDIRKREVQPAISALAKDSGRNASSKDFFSRHNFELIETNSEGVQTWISRDVPSVPTWINLKIGEEL